MASLTIAAQYSKKILLVLSIFFGGLLLLFIIFTFGKSIFEMIYPPNPDPALVAFGKLPEIPFAEGVQPPKNTAYKIETVTGDLKELNTSLKVFAIDTTSVPKFGDLASANDKAQKTQFALPPTSVVGDVATYVDSKNKSKTITINTITGDMSQTSDYINNTDLITNQIKDEEPVKSMAQAFLATFGMNPANYPQEKITTIRYKIDGGKLTEAISGSSANLIRVDFNRADLDNIPVVYSTWDKPKVTVLASAGEVVSAKATLSKIQEYRFSTYPLKGINKAFLDLKAGKAIYNKDLKGPEFSIRDVSLAYLDTDAVQTFLEPVYVFSSDEGLAAYVRAVADNWITTKPN